MDPNPEDLEEGGNQSREVVPVPVPASREPFWAPMFALSGIGALVWLTVAVVFDAVDIRLREVGSDLPDSDLTWLLLTAVPVSALMWSLAPRFGIRSLMHRILAFVLASLLAFLLGVLLMATVGLYIHVALGGRL